MYIYIYNELICECVCDVEHFAYRLLAARDIRLGYR